MKLTGTMTLFVSEPKQIKVGEETKERKFYSTNISHKDQEEGKEAIYTNMTIDVRFTSKFGDDKLAKLDHKKCYTLDVKDAWLDVRSYKKDGKDIRVPVIVINEAKCTESKDVVRKDIRETKVSEDLPF